MKKCFSALLFLFIPLAVVNAKEMNLKVPPAVFAVENEYQIMITTSSPSLIRIKIGEKFYDFGKSFCYIFSLCSRCFSLKSIVKFYFGIKGADADAKNEILRAQFSR